MHTRIGASSRTLRGFAHDPSRSKEFPDSAAFMSPTPSRQSDKQRSAPARGGRGIHSSPAAPGDPEEYPQNYLPLDKAVYDSGRRTLEPRLVNEAWAIDVVEELNGEYPDSLAATALKREGNFGREGAIDVPPRQAMTEAQQVAEDKDYAAYTGCRPECLLAVRRHLLAEYGTIHERGAEARS